MISAQGITARSLLSENNDQNVLTVRDVTKAVMAAIGVDVTNSKEKASKLAHVEDVFPILSQQLRWESRAMTLEKAQAEKEPKEQAVSLLQQQKCSDLLHVYMSCSISSLKS